MFIIPSMIMLKLLTISAEIQLSFEQYPRYAHITDYLTSLRETYPNRVRLITIGHSIQGRNITAIKISSNRKNCKKPAILLDAGIHAREWMSPLTTLYIINQIVTNPKNKYMWRNVVWYIIPLLNPDGYEYSHQKDNLWRKNRRMDSKCIGVDLNRNFGYHWNNLNNKKCTELYGGENPDSEPEIKALEKFALEQSKNIKLYITIHAFGPFIFYPMAHSNVVIPNQKEHRHLAQNVAKAIKGIRGTAYTVGQVGKLLYPASGSSLDWMVGVAKIPFGFAIELAASIKGFDPPLKERLNISIETFEGMKVFQKYIENKWCLYTNNRKSKFLIYRKNKRLTGI